MLLGRTGTSSTWHGLREDSDNHGEDLDTVTIALLLTRFSQNLVIRLGMLVVGQVGGCQIRTL